MPAVKKSQHNPYNGDVLPVVHTALLSFVRRVHVSDCVAYRSDPMRGRMQWEIVGGVSPTAMAEEVAVVMSSLSGVGVHMVSETVGRFVVHVDDARIPDLVCRHGRWRRTKDGYELEIDRPEFASMTAGTLKSFVQEKLQRSYDGDIVTKHSRMLYVGVCEHDVDTLRAWIHGRVLQDRNGWYWAPEDEEQQALLQRYSNGGANNNNNNHNAAGINNRNMSGLQLDRIRHECLPHHTMTMERAKHPPRMQRAFY